MSTANATRNFTATLAAMQASSKRLAAIADDTAAMLEAYAKRCKDRDSLTMQLHSATMASLSPVARKRVNVMADSMQFIPTNRKPITQEIYAAFTRKGTAGYIYRGDIAGGKREELGRFSSRAELDRIVANYND